MEFTEAKWSKTVEGNYDVKLILDNKVVATINFPSEELAKEYADIKTKLKSHADALIAEVTANLQKPKETDAGAFVSKAKAAKLANKVEESVEDLDKEICEDGKAVKESVFEQHVTSKVEKQKSHNHIDASAKVSSDANKVIDTSAKAAKAPETDWQESARAKVVFPE